MSTVLGAVSDSEFCGGKRRKPVSTVKQYIYLTIFGHFCLNSFSVKYGPSQLWHIPYRHSRSSVSDARGFSAWPISWFCLRRNSWLSMLVVTSITVSLEKPCKPSMGLQNNQIKWCYVLESSKHDHFQNKILCLRV